MTLSWIIALGGSGIATFLWCRYAWRSYKLRVTRCVRAILDLEDEYHRNGETLNEEDCAHLKKRYSPFIYRVAKNVLLKEAKEEGNVRTENN